MEPVNPNPLFIGLLFVLRCMIPLLILFGISYILRRLGLVAETPTNGKPSASGGANHER
ncbi:MAG: hypothetical protein ACOYYS_17595 [Chloroflexota bacterium]